MPTTETASHIVECLTERSILEALLYFDIFSYPLTAEEVFLFARQPELRLEAVAEKLEQLAQDKRIFRFGTFFQLDDDPSKAERRAEYNRRADQFLPLAARMARLIGSFPYIRGVFVSGSLSKHCMRSDSDIDFFLVTEPGRLWIARTLLAVFKKIFLFNSHKYFCINYFVDTEHLEIADKNLFAATETVTLLPMYGSDWYAAFCRANAWAYTWLPHFPVRPHGAVLPHRRGPLKKTLEWMLDNRLGDRLDGLAMRVTTGFWKRKFRHLDTRLFDHAFRSERHVSKHHPLGFQHRVMREFDLRLNALKGK